MFRSDVQADIFMIICEAARLLNQLRKLFDQFSIRQLKIIEIEPRSNRTTH